jgi:methionyl-tRNA formyltransferase
MSKSLRIVFMGTPEFAVPMLDTLVLSQHQVVGVITAPDKPAGRGMQFQQSDVKKYAVEQGLKILQPEKLKNEAFLDELRALQADLFVVVAFRMLPEVVWNMPPLGTINLHASLLPTYRGQRLSIGPLLMVKKKQECLHFVYNMKLIPAILFSEKR